MRKFAALTLTTAILFTFASCSANTQPSSGDAQSISPSEPAPQEATGIIRAQISKNCNYVYHMLSVSNSGYDNEYGDKYKSYHSEADLSTLKRLEDYITVSGGEHSGELYSLCVAIPAALDGEDAVLTYFEALADMYEGGDLGANFITYRNIYDEAFIPMGAEVNEETHKMFYESNLPLGQEILDISKVMINNYDIYSNKIWDESKEELTASADSLNAVLAGLSYADDWQNTLGVNYANEHFNALIVNSIEGGANCINITDDKDVFLASDDSEAQAKLISHEFGIFLLMDALRDTQAFRDNKYYNITEGLAEYYNIEVSGGDRIVDWDSEYIAFFKELRDSNPQITPREMFDAAVERFLEPEAE